MTDFLTLDDAIEAVAIAAALSPKTARQWIDDFVREDRVRLRDGRGNVLRYSDTRLGRAAPRGERTAQRYNPNARRRMAASAAASRPAARESLAPSIDGYTVHAADLGAAIARDHGLQVNFAPSRDEYATSAPVDQILEFMRVHGHQPDFVGLPKERWQLELSRGGISFGAGDFEAAWRLGRQRGYIEATDHAPLLEKRTKPALRAAEAPIKKSC